MNSGKIFLLLVLMMLAAACARHGSLNGIDIPSTPILSSDERYAVIIEPYVSMRDKPGENGITIAHSRRGDLFTVKGRRILEMGDARILWIDLGAGWVIESSVQLYSGEDKARTAAKLLD